MRNLLRKPDFQGIESSEVESEIIAETFKLTPKLIFGTMHDINFDNSTEDILYFPTFSQVKTRHSNSDIKALNCFIQSIKDAQDRIWILDAYLFKPEGKEINESLINKKINEILAWFDEETSASSIRFMTRKTDGLEALKEKCEEHMQLINTSKVGKKGRVSINLKYLPEAFEIIHDRFAIVDNELWHFGAAVAGLNAGLNASSRGWSAKTSKAIIFFDEIWNQVK